MWAIGYAWRDNSHACINDVNIAQCNLNYMGLVYPIVWTCLRPASACVKGVVNDLWGVCRQLSDEFDSSTGFLTKTGRSVYLLYSTKLSKEKHWQISQFWSHLRNFSPRNLGVPYPPMIDFSIPRNKPVIKVGTTVLSNPDYFTYHYASDQE